VERITELAKRAKDLVMDPRNLAEKHWFEPHPDGYGSVQGHVDQFNQKQKNLMRMLSDWDDNDCGQRLQLPENVEEYATRPAPYPYNRLDNLSRVVNLKLSPQDALKYLTIGTMLAIVARGFLAGLRSP
jgi:hypothetical protein